MRAPVILCERLHAALTTRKHAKTGKSSQNQVISAHSLPWPPEHIR